ncbi:RNA recognition motif domain [Dillenia turbinata]|uniref:RNA recognition motif domain n=1 Tax=Dillenia turbinata TaxID=194707 RepID=A0AAN8UKK0_9MAGN
MEDEVHQVEAVVEETVVNLSSSPLVDDSADEVESLPSDDHDDNHPDTAAVSSSVDLEDKIVKQVEYYFSEENVLAKNFYKKYVKRNKEGFVPIEAIASFRKMKKLTRDIPFITNALRKSSLLALNSEGTMVKSLHPLSFSFKEPKFCTVLVENLPGDHSKENIQKIFGQAGNIKSISIRDLDSIEESTKVVKPGRPISGKVHALVEYDSEDAAEKAVATLNDAEDWRNGMHVVLLRSRLSRGLDKERARAKSKKDSKVHTSEAVGDGRSHNPGNHHETADDGDGKHLPKERPKEKNGRRNRNHGRSRGQTSHAANGHGHGNPSSSLGTEHTKPPPGPRIPDGTRGFTMGRGRPVAPSPN